MSVGVRLAATLLCCLLGHIRIGEAQQTAGAPDLSGESLEQLTKMQLRVSSFARKDQDLWVTPAAVFVITREDIERSAATSVPDILRTVPGLQVAQVNASTWAVSARGFNSAYADKLLVLIDGRSVYSEIYSGVHWDESALPLESIERIEVVRGPGAAVWGANAFNGVINIITRRARGSEGFEVSVHSDRIAEAIYLRYGGSINDRLQYRGYTSFLQSEALDNPFGQKAFDGEKTLRGGARVEWQRDKANRLTLSTETYGGYLEQQVLPSLALNVGPGGENHGSIAGVYALGRWEHTQQHQDSALQFYFGKTSRHEVAALALTTTYDLDYQNHLLGGKRNDLVWGSEFRYTSDVIGGAIPLSAKPVYENYLLDGFLQDDVTLVPHRLILTLGGKLQDGTLGGFQVQPSVRMLWAPDEKQSAWAAFSRASTAPALQYTVFKIPLTLGMLQGLPLSATLEGSPAFKPESVDAFEVGYRRRVGSTLTVDTAAFFNFNHRFASLAAGDVQFVPTPAPSLHTDLVYTNGSSAKTTGIETAVLWKPLSRFSLQASYAWMQARTVEAGAGTIDLPADTWNTPRHSVTGVMSWEIAQGYSLNAFTAYVSALPPPIQSPLDSSIPVPQYARVDLHLHHRIGRYLEADAGGTNLLTPRHREIGNGVSAVTSLYIPRSLFLNVKWTF